jgi:hypothetical protein
MVKPITCPNCGSLPGQTIVQARGYNLYHCMRPLHRLEVQREGNQIVFKSIPTFCDTIMDDTGKVVKGWIGYLTAGIEGLTNPKIKTKVRTEKR